MSAATTLASGVLVMLVAAPTLTRTVARRPTSDPRSTPRTARWRGRLRLPAVCRRPNQAIRPMSLAAWADELARALRHGSTLRAALATVVPEDPTIARHSEPLRHRLSRGATVADACDEWTDEIAGLRLARSPMLTTLSSVISAAARLGGSAAAPLDRFARAMRQRASDDLERSAQSAQARLSARVLTMVPLAVLVLLVATDDDVRGVVAQPLGAFAVGIGLVLNALGGWWMRHIVRHTTETTAT